MEQVMDLSAPRAYSPPPRLHQLQPQLSPSRGLAYSCSNSPVAGDSLGHHYPAHHGGMHESTLLQDERRGNNVDYPCEPLHGEGYLPSVDDGKARVPHPEYHQYSHPYHQHQQHQHTHNGYPNHHPMDQGSPPRGDPYEDYPSPPSPQQNSHVSRVLLTHRSTNAWAPMDTQDCPVPTVGDCSPGMENSCPDNSPPSSESPRSCSPGLLSGKVTSLGARPHVLPPCKVCDAPATGFHYGVNTCEACKGFFRRSLLRKGDYVCVKSTKCSIQRGKRNMCAACRYQRCLTVGMSKEGIKTGRYTYEKRTSDILELKRLHTEEARQRVLSRQEQLAHRFELLVAKIVRAQERNHKDALRTNPIIDQIHTSFLEKKQKSSTQQEAAPSSSSSSSSSFLSSLSSSEPHAASVGPGIASPAESVASTLPESTEPKSDSVDDQRAIMETWIKTAEKGLKQMVGFAKDLPGFNTLPLTDQMMLLKNSIAEAWVITRHKAFNVEHGCYSAHCGFTFDISKAFDEDFVNVLLTVVRRMQQLKLTYEETCLLKAMSFFFSDRCDLKAPEEVDAVQLELVDALIYMLAKNHPDKPQMFAHIILVFTDLRTITDMYHKHNEKVLSWTDMARTPLMWEVLSYSKTTYKHDDEDEDGIGPSGQASDKAPIEQIATEN